MNAVRLAISGIVLSALFAGGLLYYTMVYAYYTEVDAPAFGQVELVSAITGQPEPILTENLTGIDSDSSPIRFRACFDTPVSIGTLTDTYTIYEDAEPLNAPGWFSCFDAKSLGAQLETGEAIAFLAKPTGEYGIDRVVAVTPDGHGYMWNQINECGSAVYGGDAAPEGCPTPPEGITN